MNRRCILAFSGALVFTCVSLSAYLVAPYAARRYIEKEFPGVTVKDVKLRTTGARLSLDVDRHGIRATLPDVWITRDKRVVVTGGHVWLTRGASAEASSGVAKQLTASDLTVEVTRKDWGGHLEGVALAADGTVTIAKGTGKHQEVSGIVEGVRKTPDGVVVVDRAEVTMSSSSSRSSWRLDAVDLALWHAFSQPSRVGYTPMASRRPEDLDDPIKQPFTLEGITLTADRKRASVKTITAAAQRANGVKIDFGGPTLRVLVDSAVIQHPWLSPVATVFNRNVRITVADGMITAEIGNAGISWNREAKTVEGVGSCEAWVAAFPDGLRDPLEGFTFTGKVDFKVNYGNKPSVTIKGGCYAKCDSKKIKALHKPFHYMVYSAKNELVDRVSGPNSKDWTPLGVMALTLPTAVITMEDPGFVYHRGFVVAAYRNSLVDNLKLGRFHRGGSTISMQLAKNLWLRRDKTLGRKAQEFFLAQALESCFSKDQILELYLNVVEFGADLYGVGPAAQRYFKVPVEMLSPVQAYWLASILPRPRSAVPPNEAALERIRNLMSTLESSRSSGLLDAIGTTR
jgi:hypothetical protein